jgi:hypothetical protein
MTLNKLVKALAIAFLFIANVAYAQTNNQSANQADQALYNNDERDFDALREFIRTKREIPLEEKDNDMSISGDVRFEWRHLTETADHKNLRGGSATRDGKPVSRNDWDVEFNLRFDYVNDRTWAVAHLGYDNSAGVDDSGNSCSEDPEGYHGSGTCDGICLKKAYFGYRLCDDGRSQLEVEIGRRNLYNVFDSRIQFDSRFDGILLQYKSECCGIGKWYWSAAGFIIDERVNHFGWVTEIGVMDICNTGFDFKYSLIDWQKRGKNRCNEENPDGMRFLNSQWTTQYTFTPDFLRKKTVIFGAFLINHLGAHGHYYGNPRAVVENVPTPQCSEDGTVTCGFVPKTHYEADRFTAKNQNKGWYTGFRVGKVDKEGDWSFEAMYQYVQAFAIPDEDVSGIGRGNVNNTSITARIPKNPQFLLVGQGNTNFKGWRFEGLYAITDELTLDTILEFTQSVKSSIGGSHNYSKFEIETVYAF